METLKKLLECPICKMGKLVASAHQTKKKKYSCGHITIGGQNGLACKR